MSNEDIRVRAAAAATRLDGAAKRYDEARGWGIFMALRSWVLREKTDGLRDAASVIRGLVDELQAAEDRTGVLRGLVAQVVERLDKGAQNNNEARDLIDEGSTCHDQARGLIDEADTRYDEAIARLEALI